MRTYTYICKSHPAEFATFAEQLKADEYNLGTTWQDYLSGKWVKLNTKQKAFREAHPEATPEEVWNQQIEEYVRTLVEAKADKLNEIDAFDNSSEVNGFIAEINGEEVEGWFTAAERSNHRASIDAAKLLNVETISLYLGNTAFTLSTITAERILAQIQLYADQCYIVTKRHKAAVEALESIEAVDSYDYYEGYPEKLRFEL